MTDNTQQARAAVTPEAIEAAAKKIAACYGVVDFDSLNEYDRGDWFDLIRSAVQ